MAAVANAAFELRVSNHMYDTTKNVTGKFQASSADAIVSAGFLCVETTRLPLEGYASMYNENAWIMNAAATGAGEIYACNPHDVQSVTADDGNVYRVGKNTLGLNVPAGKRETYTRLDKGDIVRIGAGLFTATPASGEVYGIIANGKVTADDAAPETAGLLYLDILDSGTFTTGAYAGMGYYLCRVNRV